MAHRNFSLTENRIDIIYNGTNHTDGAQKPKAANIKMRFESGYYYIVKNYKTNAIIQLFVAKHIMFTVVGTGERYGG